MLRPLQTFIYKYFTDEACFIMFDSMIVGGNYERLFIQNFTFKVIARKYVGFAAALAFPC